MRSFQPCRGRQGENYNKFRTVQEKTVPKIIFLERTDALAVRLGISLRSLAPKLGLSVASLFGYRNGTIPISSKAWRKLEQAETSATCPNRSNNDPIDELTPEQRMARMEGLMQEMAERFSDLSNLITDSLTKNNH